MKRERARQQVTLALFLALFLACGSPAGPAECTENPKDTPVFVIGSDTTWVRTYYCR